MPDVMAKYALSNAIKRSLTPSEKALARSIFSYGLNLEIIYIHNTPYSIFQGRFVAMSPNGAIWFNTADYKRDFSQTVADAAWLVHELTHVWQYQTGRSVRVRGLFEQLGRLRGSDPYPYGKIDVSRKFTTYKNEQQAAMVEDYYRIRHKLPARYGSGSVEDYEIAIPFLPKRISPQRVSRA